jgi:polyhydroxyalkanoate synthase
MADSTINNDEYLKGRPLGGGAGLHDMMLLLQNSTDILKKYLQILEKILSSKNGNNDIADILDLSKVQLAITNVITSAFSDPYKTIDLQKRYCENAMKIINYATSKMQGSNPAPAYEATNRDRRFQHEDWYTKLQFDVLKQFYLMNTEWVNSVMDKCDDVDLKTKTLAKFYVNQMIDALAPTNFLITNPEAIQEGIATHAGSLVNGLNNLLVDLERSKGIFDIARTDSSEFTLGKNIACTPGQVVYRNEMIELIYYTPKETVYDIPLLIIPPWINRYYILDLSPKNSFVKWVVDQGFSVFLISWVNPGPSLREKCFDDYAKEGALAAINFILKKFKKEKVNLLSYCIGGTMTSMLLAYLAQHKKESIINTASFLTTLLDFSDAGDISIFIDEEQLDRLDKSMEKTGFFDGGVMNLSFNMLRSNELIWFFVVNNYLLGKTPVPFDLFYWNAQATRLPAKMHSFYLRNMYLENNLIKPNKLEMDGTKIDLSKITVPCHFMATERDHIAPWKGVYKATEILTCPLEFTLAGSGHVAGIVNPEGSKKYGYWTNKNKTLPKNPEDWLKTAEEKPGSWWPHWGNWLIQNSGKKITSSGQKKIADSLMIEKAPGSYVRDE